METRDNHRAGAVKQITSHSNPIVKEIKGLVAQRKNRKQSGLFVAEGLKLATDALEAGWGVRYLALGPEARENKIALEAAAKAKARGALILEVNTAVLGAITRRDNPQMVVGVYEQQTMKLSDIDPKSATTWIALDRVRDPGNLGTIIRTGDAVGATGVILIDETTDPFAVETVRATMGSLFHMPLVRCTADEFVEFRKSWSGSVVGTHLRGTKDYRAVDYKEPVILLMGNEQAGLSDKLADTCSDLVKIPQAGQADSMNLAVATAVMLYEVRRNYLKL
ncbi:23S rRNA (uridine(2479)-2'-O)-methyltransferase [Pseudovibrio sp. Ad13]|uniref:TrmH family RNA methyltransferase n=1 Tax=unclassified Pseudovibrio TaxID=2627060 RepID=UPI0007AEDF87|nr:MULTISPECIES: RNA methyltransferase [unclassified Pseudovibrio]KZK85986.1 23S rRNA (uridine(2479)-2'-O)-methyltransferase [Pseudovibrio sp. Ad13]KZL01150.1 23S rRNA (uridine(2479)-2'-O)-methyltransferase [Pseudovibrio sp. W74]KZL11215.1 23S rRNA (uridine(2479)-2'-O)-methyltransferase [Pseudovibrio sp. Ad14]